MILVISVESDRFTVQAIFHPAKKRFHDIHYAGVLPDILFHFVTFLLEFPVLADYCILPVGQKLVYATHGHSYNTKNPPPLMPGDILLHGHTHVPAWQEFGEGNLYLNPGSLSIPKENSPHSYMTLEEGLFRWKELESGKVYHQIKV